MSTSKENVLPSVERNQLKREIIKLQHLLAGKKSEIVRLKTTRSQFVGRLAHDQRNPLGAVLSFSGYFYNKKKEMFSDVQKDLLSRIHNSAQLISSLITNLIEILRMDAGNLNTNAGIFDIVSLTTENIKLKRELAAEKNITFNFEKSDPVVYIYADAKRLEQVFHILFSNAIMVSDPGAAIKVAISKEYKKVQIRVADSGMGMAAKNQNKIFIQCGKIAGKETNDKLIAGLGLAIAKRIIEDHKGEICVESDIGKGSSFIVSLPLN
jgi:signal transduction histidine kinase